jgi:hypothetical protein
VSAGEPEESQLSTAAAAPADTGLAEEMRAVALVVGSMVGLQVVTAAVPA